MLKKISLLNPKVKNNHSNDSIDNIEIPSTSTSEGVNINSLQFPNNFQHNNIILNEDDNDVLNLWSQTNFFFDPVDPTKISNIYNENYIYIY